MAHEPEDEDPVHHSKAEGHETAAGKTSGELRLVIVECKQVRDHSGQVVIFREVVMHISVVLSDPLIALLVVVFVALLSSEPDPEGVVNASHAVFLEPTKNRRGIHTLRVPDALTVGVSRDLYLIGFCARASAALSITFTHSTNSCFPMVAYNAPDCIRLSLLESSSQVVRVDVEVELGQKLTGISAANYNESYEVNDYGDGNKGGAHND